MRRIPENDLDQIRRILAAAQETRRYSNDTTRQMFHEDRVLQLAVERLVQNIGEAASQLTDDFISARDHIPWAKMVGMRHRLVHDFASVDLDIIWDTVQNSLPTLIAELERMLEYDLR